MAIRIVNNLVPTSWTSNTNLVGTAVAHKDCQLQIDAPGIDTTAFAASLNATTHINGLRSAVATLSGRFNPAYNCSGIGLTLGSGYTANLYSFNMNLAWVVHDTTVGTGSAITARSYIPGLLTVSGTFNAYVDDTTVLTQPGSTVGDSATFKLIETGTGTDHTIAGNVIISSLGAGFPVGGKPTVAYGYTFTGDVTAAGNGGSHTASPFPTGTIVAPTAGTLTLTAPGSDTYVGSAFSSAISVTAAVGEELAIAVTAQFSGGVTITAV